MRICGLNLSLAGNCGCTCMRIDVVAVFEADPARSSSCTHGSPHEFQSAVTRWCIGPHLLGLQASYAHSSWRRKCIGSVYTLTYTASKLACVRNQWRAPCPRSTCRAYQCTCRNASFDGRGHRTNVYRSAALLCKSATWHPLRLRGRELPR